VSVPLKPCDSCGAMVPEYTRYPYPECGDDCELSNQWRREHERDQVARDVLSDLASRQCELGKTVCGQTKPFCLPCRARYCFSESAATATDLQGLDPHEQ
jgi:hypothetical protein